MSNENQLILDLKVIPNSKEFNAEFDKEKNLLKVKAKSKPLDGKANQEVEKELKKILKTEVSIVKGFKTRNKKVLIKNKTIKEVIEKLL